MNAHPKFELVVATTKDGFIAKHSGHQVPEWSSKEEQSRFFQCFEGTDFAIMGRVTHEQVLRSERWRIIFSTRYRLPTWVGERHLWIDPNRYELDEILKIASERHAADHNLLLGGTTVHDWFLDRHKITNVQLAIEPLTFGEGLPLFSQHRCEDPCDSLRKLGFEMRSEEILNEQGSLWTVWSKPH